MGNQVTLYVKADEDEAIKKIMASSGLKRHHIIKFALRRFLFPDEKTVPLNGKKVIVKDQEVLSDTMKALELDKGFAIQPREWDFKKETKK